ncbi:MAG TPA: hypothetical protein VGJ90_03150 [Methylophilaceae bacterium]
MVTLWIIMFGFIAGIIARLAMSSSYNPIGFLIATTLGIGGSLAVTYLGHLTGWYKAGSAEGLIGAFVGAMALPALYHLAIRK